MQGKVVKDNVKGAARGYASKRQKREYRQYMNKTKRKPPPT